MGSVRCSRGAHRRALAVGRRHRYPTLHTLSTLNTDQRNQHAHSPRLAYDHLALAAYCLLVRRLCSAQAHLDRAREIVVAGLGKGTVLYMAVLNVAVGSCGVRCRAAWRGTVA